MEQTTDPNGKDVFAKKGVTVTVTCKPKLTHPSSSTGWMNDMYSARLRHPEEHEVQTNQQNSIPSLSFMRDSLYQYQFMTIQEDYMKISEGDDHVEREALCLEVLLKRIKWYDNEEPDSPYKTQLSVIRTNCSTMLVT